MASETLGIDYAWLSFKSYFEDNNKCKTQWEWLDPITESFALHIDQLVDDIAANKPDVVGFSLYVWNVGLSLRVAELVKQRLPNVNIIVGGPHVTYKDDVEYFKRYPFIDTLCKEDGYGELFITEYLYQLEQPAPDFSVVPYCVYPSQSKGFWKVSNTSFYKRDFKWPSNIFSRNADYISGRVAKSTAEGRKLYVAYESSRGCPFGCTYCEWGGGINSKVTFKPTEMVIEDMNYIFEHIQPFFFSFTDANFGIVDRDVDLIKHLCEWKQKTDFPKVVYYFGPSKVNKHNVYQIEGLTAKYGMLQDYKVPLQDLNREVLVNIDRTDEDWQVQLEEYIKVRDQYGGVIRLEMILGLPGATLDSYFDALDYSCGLNTFGARYVWHLLPTTPASDPAYREKFKIKSLQTSFGMRSTIDGGQTIMRKQHVEDVAGPRHLVVEPEWMVPTEIVIETMSYTREEWTTMFALDNIIVQTEVGHLLSLLTRYLSQNDVPYSEFYRKFWEQFLYGNNKLTAAQNSLLQHMKKQLLDKVNQPSVVDFNYFDTPEGYPFQTRSWIGPLFNMMVMTNVNAFYQALGEWCYYEFGEDPIRNDLIRYLANSVKTIVYTPGQYQYSSEHDWVDYANTGKLNKVKTIYTPQDVVPWSDTDDLNIRIKQHFLPLCSNLAKTKLFRDTKVSYE